MKTAGTFRGYFRAILFSVCAALIINGLISFNELYRSVASVKASVEEVATTDHTDKKTHRVIFINVLDNLFH